MRTTYGEKTFRLRLDHWHSASNNREQSLESEPHSGLSKERAN